MWCCVYLVFSLCYRQSAFHKKRGIAIIVALSLGTIAATAISPSMSSPVMCSMFPQAPTTACSQDDQRFQPCSEPRPSLAVPPAAIAEFAPPASQALMVQITAGVDPAEVQGWIEFDTDTLEPTGRRIFTPFPTDDDPAA